MLFVDFQHFRTVAIDIDYVEDIVWPTLILAEYYDTPHKIKNRKIDPYTAFEDAGVELKYNPKESDKVRKFLFSYRN